MRRRGYGVIAGIAAAVAIPATAQHHGHGSHDNSATHAVADDPDCPADHAAMGHCTPRSAARPDDARTPPAITPRPVPSPSPVAADYADRIWGRDAMAASRALLRREHGGGVFHQVIVNIAEIQPRSGGDGYRWDGEGWFGGDVDRLALKTEGEGVFRHGPAAGEVQALYSRAIGPYFNLQAGARQDFGRGPARTYAVAGIEGLAPYWFDVEAALFLSDRGDLLARMEGYHDLRITQRLIVQPRAEINLSAQDMPANRIGAGLVGAEAGLRLRYEIAREFAPYIGVTWERRFGTTRRYARSTGVGDGGFAVAFGLRTWF